MSPQVDVTDLAPCPAAELEYFHEHGDQHLALVDAKSMKWVSFDSRFK